MRSRFQTPRRGWRIRSCLETDFGIVPSQRLPPLAFARQWLPEARHVHADSVRAWAGALFEALAGVLPDDLPWTLHVEPHYGARATRRIGARAWHSRMRQAGEARSPKSTVQNPALALQPARVETQRQSAERGCVGLGEPGIQQSERGAGRHRCLLIRQALLELLQRKRRHLLRRLRPEPGPFTANDSLAQLLLTAPDAGFISIAPAPLPFEQRHLLSPFPKGEVLVATDPAAPSRAFAKLVEAGLRLGRVIQAGETCVDLGASPGSWTYEAVNRGARVLAVDRAPLRADLMRHRQVEFQPGDAFRFQPPRPVDWLLCDVIAAPERTSALLVEWLRRGWCRQFVVTVKLKDTSVSDVLARLKRDLPPLTRDLFLTRLCANKKELCAFGQAGIS